MNASALKEAIRERLWSVVESEPGVLSATLTGSFLETDSLEGISDIDLVLILDTLDGSRYRRLLNSFDDSLRPELLRRGYDLRINPTLGPLKFNDPQTAVLHLMLYSHSAHVEHVLQSPFTCLDWQRSPAYRKRSMAEVFPVFGLQPGFFVGARRSVRDYLRDLDAGAVSYRELIFGEADGYREEKRSRPMTVRDRHEFAYHVMRFLMQNLLKLLTRRNEALGAGALLAGYFSAFPDGQGEFGAFFTELLRRKQACDFTEPVPDLEARLQAFASSFETQFRQVFFATATRHVAFRHAPTALNLGRGGERIFLGRADPEPLPIDPRLCSDLRATVNELSPRAVYTSPARRCRRSLQALRLECDLPDSVVDERLQEIEYGRFEGLTVARARGAFPEVFAAWGRGEDPRFPGGESTADVLARAESFVREPWQGASGNTLACTHNVVLRCLVGSTLGVPARLWHRLQVPHLAPITFVQTRRYGLFVDVPTEAARAVFADFAETERVKAA